MKSDILLMMFKFKQNDDQSLDKKPLLDFLEGLSFYVRLIGKKVIEMKV